EEERSGLVTVDEPDRLPGEGVREIRVVSGRDGAAENARRVEVVVRTAEEAEELVEPPFLRVSLARAEVPFAHQAGAVSGRFEPVGHRRFGQWQAQVGPMGRIEFVTEPRLVPAGEEPGPGRRTVRSGNVPAGKP